VPEADVPEADVPESRSESRSASYSLKRLQGSWYRLMLLRAIASIVNFTMRGAVFLGIAVLGGFGTAWIMIHSGSQLTAANAGPWVTWSAAGRMDADPYTRAHTVRLGLLPLNSTLARTFQAQSDASGQRIHSSCVYTVDVTGLDAEWWSLAVFDERGGLIRNASNRYAFNSSTVLRDPDGGTRIVVSREARPGNWLPTSGAGRLSLSLSVQDPRWVSGLTEQGRRARVLPEIRTVSCR
jgi:hypothetical protein